jgi:hypothetical protein
VLGVGSLGEVAEMPDGVGTTFQLAIIASSISSVEKIDAYSSG